MKVLVLGGFGIMGSSTARDLIKSPAVTKVTLADREIDLERVHPSLGTSPKVSPEKFDITDRETLISLIKDHDVVVNCVGPFYKYGLSAIKAAIEAQTGYIDICDDYDVTIEALDLHEEAKRAGATICIGCGDGPGLSNLIAKYAADKLEEVDKIHILWAGSLGDDMGLAVLPHALHSWMGEVPQFIDGKLVYVPAGSGAEVVDFLEPVGKCEVYYFGHPEPITMPRYIQGVKTVVNKGANLPTWLNELFTTFINLGLVSSEPVRIGDSEVIPTDFLTTVLKRSEYLKKQASELTISPCNVVVKGRDGNKRVTYTYRVIGKMAPGTAITASMVAQMIGGGEITDKGVFAPEGCVNANLILSRWKERGLHLNEQKTIEQDV